ncbi:FAD-binding and (Fe-S)-binding domain-containing protein [Corynebacterium pseudodiphtheriticum]|uniref:FAD-binding and (Fe-S)-binding domain-containing protein n=1 Tax=Corynebacterium pseudodiphtheriticum TaxID=37637 RepID=UPI00254C57B3|nr:FAD-binding and (Fe-S)-binding domain-containing protein [Corynebacterium pseudodiphtheriticum]MDK8700073.1 FAD-binding and (Fe-S)-binding domain-containing protein [Corynebacterium pseudodiphtheriticum]MDK8774337.1 FAD-binding and (Fe-S)-binding domain-containing protein [Corynebacterium pseudodiphtheriticum]
MKKLLTPNPRSYGRPENSTPQSDAVPTSHLHADKQQLVDDMSAIVGPENVHARISDIVRYASDGGPYRLLPQVIVAPRNTQDLSRVMRYATDHGRNITFRSAGTSLNGQAQGDDLLVDLKTHFTGMEVREGGKVLWSRPGVVLGDAQAVLGRDGFMLGPDPGSTSVCTIGGVLANNAGGMRCRLENDSYHSIRQAEFVLPSGTIVDTRAGDAKFRSQEPELHAGLLQLRDKIRSDEQLVTHLREKFSIRNTNGLRLDAFLDEEEPVRILMRLLVGSEGIFGAFTECELATVALPKKKAVAWVMLPDLFQAANYVAPLMETGAWACELLVAPVLKKSVENFDQAPAEWADISDESAALLLEVGGANDDELAEAMDRVKDVLADADLGAELEFLTSEADIRGAWAIRNGLFGLLGADRPQGSALITEDVCFPPAQIGAAAADLLHLLSRYGYPEMVMGHAAFGNLHFFLIPEFDDPKEKEKYAEFLRELADLVIDKYNGSLKAEHGTGINMAPFVRQEWGDAAWNLMWEAKQLIDPTAMLAPDVKLTHRTDNHLHNFKSFPRVEAEINPCVECGFCEPVCPSRHATVTPRQRIVLRREMARQAPGSPVLQQLQKEYQYDAVDMCAADGTCAIPCPISIDTGAVMKNLRARQVTPRAEKVALTTAEKWDVVEKLARAGIISANKVGEKAAGWAANMARTVINPDLVPAVPGALPKAASRLPATERSGANAVYFPACVNRIFGRPAGSDPDTVDLPRAMVELARRSGQSLWIPDDVTGFCCGTPWSSKGYQDGFSHQAHAIVRKFHEWSDGGKLPIIIDASSCTHGLLSGVPAALDAETKQLYDELHIIDIVEWLHKDVIDYLPIHHDMGTIAVHPACSTQHMGQTEALVAVANHAGQASVPFGAMCCGTAGDRGLLHPELVESATREERTGLDARHYDAFVSSNRTCEMGLDVVAGYQFDSVAVLLEKASRPVVTP